MTKTTEKIWTILQQTIGEDAALHLIEKAQTEIKRAAAEDIAADLADCQTAAEALETVTTNYL